MTLRQPSPPQMVSACCLANVEVRGSVTHYYVCTKCGYPTDPRLNPKAIQR